MSSIGRRHHLSVVAACLLVVTACSPTTTTAQMTTGGQDVDPAPGYEGAPVEGTPSLPHATFASTEGGEVDLRDLATQRPTLLYVGYTHCPDICPVHMATLAQALRSSTVRPEQLNVVFVTGDPERDTLAVLDDYLAAFDRSFVGLRSSPEAVDDLLTDLGLPPIVIEDGASDAEGYTVGHPGQLLAIDTDGRARLQYPFGTRQSQWVEDLPKLVRGDWPS